MIQRTVFYLSVVLSALASVSCNSSLRCEKHILQKGFTGKVRIEFSKATGQDKIDAEGCINYEISASGNCPSALPFVQGTAEPKVTLRFFERLDNQTLNELFEFDLNEYREDSIGNSSKKYIFISRSGFDNPTGSNPNHFFEYFVDYGRSYETYL